MAPSNGSDTGYYDAAYDRSTDALYVSIRREAFGEEIGQFSWVTAEEYRRFFELLGIDEATHVVEIASGSGGPALFMAEQTGCRVTGFDLHHDGVAAGNRVAAERGLDTRVTFVCADVREELPAAAETFDALTCIDSINHLYDREHVFAEWHRVLRPGARALFTDPITVTGRLRAEETAARSSSMGEFVFTPVGVNEELLRAAGFGDIVVEDRTTNMWEVAERWSAARARHEAGLVAAEGEDAYRGFQRFLDVVATLARERRLSRPAIIATKR